MPVVVQPLDSRSMEPQIRRSNANTNITLYGHGTHHRTGSIDVKPRGTLANVNSITVKPETNVQMTSSDGSTQSSIEFPNETRIHKGWFI